MAELDLQEATRRDDVYNQLNTIIGGLKEVPVFPVLVWLWSWDIVVDIYENHKFEDAAESDYDVIPKDVTLKQIWDKFWVDADTNGFTLEYGTESLHEAIDDWMRENDFLVILDDDGWLDD
jgi:hypothetical protein